MATILDLSPELIALLTDCLSNTDIKTLRCTSLYLNQSTFRTFATRSFRKKGFMITDRSLAVLRQISEHNVLRNHVQHLWFNPDCYTFVKYSDLEDLDECAVNDRFTCRIERFRACIADHLHLLQCRRLANELAACFDRLPNLAVLGMRRGTEYKAFDSLRLQQEIGLDPRNIGCISSSQDETLSETTLLFIAFVQALGSSSTSITRLYVDAIEFDDILPTHVSFDAASRALQSIRCLEVNLIPLRHTFFASGLAHYLAKCGTQVAAFLQCMPALSDVSFNMLPFKGKRDSVWSCSPITGYCR